MGGAAYNRGSRAITRGACAANGCRGCWACWEKPAPTPRPPGWGSATAARAAKAAERLVAYFKCRDTALTIEDLTWMVQDRAKCGMATARTAAEAAITEKS